MEGAFTFQDWGDPDEEEGKFPWSIPWDPGLFHRRRSYVREGRRGNRTRMDPLFTGIRHPGVTPGKSLTNEALSKPGLEPRSNRTDTQFLEGNVFPLIIDSLPSKVCIADEKGIRDEGQTEATNVRRCDGWNGDSKAKEEAIDTGARKRRLHGFSGGLWCVTQLELRSDGQLLRERWSSKGSMWSSRKNLPSLCRFLLRDRASTNGRFRERFRRKMRCRSAV